jgi:hypothetical protein
MTEPIFTDLTPEQADGRSCIWCGTEGSGGQSPGAASRAGRGAGDPTEAAMTSGQITTNHAAKGPLTPDCTAVSITLEPGGFYLVTAAGPRGVQSVVVGDVAAAARAAVMALGVAR